MSFTPHINETKLNQKELKRLFKYNKNTGQFTRKISVSENAKAGSFAGVTPRDGRYAIRINDILYFSHRLAWLYVHGDWPKGEIDHINHNPLDNRIINLRVVTHRVNCINQSLRSTNTSGVNGVYWLKHKRLWLANITINGRLVYLCKRKDKFEAICARLSANNKYGFHENHGLKL